ncbi:MDR family MFS transporter [Streptomyces sp. NPDC050610]|uniref:MDR family MFS transporter n=1 Tax=Streptomyces sp. NPDC050610 TaxID=3157097 RepID=UPI0034186ED1
MMAASGDPGGVAGADPDRMDRRTGLACGLLILGAFLALLDTTIVSVGMDRIGEHLHSPLSTIQWIGAGYMLAMAVAIPLSGWAVDRFGGRRMWMGTLALFLVASALSGLAWDASSLIVFRVVQGFAGGLIEPVAQTMIARTAGPRRVGRVMSLVQIPMMLAPVFGPVIGGSVMELAGWRWLFFLNLPIGAAALLLARRVLPKDEPAARPADGGFDTLGFALLSPGLGLLVYGLSQAGTGARPGSATVVVPVVLGALLLLGYAVHALRTKGVPLIDLRLFANGKFARCTVMLFMLGFTVNSGLFMIPLYDQIVRGEGPVHAGLMVAPQGLGAALVLPFVSRLTDRFGARGVVPFGMALACVGTFAYTQIDAGTGQGWLAFWLFVRGVGTGATFGPALGAAYQAIGEAVAARATSALYVLLQLGGAIGTGGLALLFQNRIAAAIPGATGTPSAADDPSLAAPLAHAFGEAFWAGVAVCAAAVVVGLFLPGRYKGGEESAPRAGAGQDAAAEASGEASAADAPAPPAH